MQSPREGRKTQYRCVRALEHVQQPHPELNAAPVRHRAAHH